MEEVPSPLPLVRPKRKKPDLTGIEPKEITIKTKSGEKNLRSPKQA